MVNLRFNENTFGGPHFRYPDNGLDELIRLYAAALESIDPAPPGHLREWSRANIVITRGAVDALDLVLRTFFEPGIDAVAVTPPNFGFFDRLTALHGVARHPVPLGGERFDRLDVGRLVELPVKGVLLCDPNNPSGTRLHPGDVDELLARFQGLVIVDETYAELAGRPSHRHRVAGRPNLVVLRSMSKAFGMAGLRLGAVLAEPGPVAALRRAQPPFGIPGPVIEHAVAELADVPNLRRRIAAFVEERDRLAAALARSPQVGRVFAEAGFVTVEVADVPDAMAALHRAGFEAVAEPDGLRAFLRISVGSPPANSRLIEALCPILPRTDRSDPLLSAS